MLSLDRSPSPTFLPNPNCIVQLAYTIIFTLIGKLLPPRTLFEMFSTQYLSNVIFGMFLFFSAASANTYSNQSFQNSNTTFGGIASTSTLQNQSSQNSNITFGWTDNPSTRGTLDIILNCLFTIIACTWSVQNLDIPDSGQINLLRKIGYLAIGILCPEYLFSKAVFDRLSNNRDMAGIRQHIRPNPSRDRGWILQEKVRWIQKILPSGQSNRKAPTAEEVGLRDVPYDTVEESHPTIEVHQRKFWTHTHTAYVNMGGLRVVVQDDKKPFIIIGHDIAEIDFDSAYSPLRLFSMSKDEILDKSKEDWFTKLITVIQIVWLVLSVIARRASGLPASQLEILTLAFAAVALATYVVQWTKPQGINIATTIHLRRFSDNPTIDRDIRQVLRQEKRGHSKEISMFSCISFTIPAIIFGALHFVAWNFSFPSTIELIIWRSATITITFLPIVFCIPWLFVFVIEPNWSEEMKSAHWGSFFTCMTIYGLARLCVIGVAVSSLRSMPADVYLSTTWSKFLPNFH